MAGFITFADNLPESETWSVANWAFRSLLNSIINARINDSQLVHELTVASAHQILELGEIANEDADLHKRIVQSIRDVIERINHGEYPAAADGRDLDEKSQAQYREALSSLLELVDKKYPAS